MKMTILAAASVAVTLTLGGFLAAAQQQSKSLTVRSSAEHGDYIADGQGRTLYLFEVDTQGTGGKKAESTCYDACAEAWPPLIGENPQAGEQVKADLIGSTERRDGQIQITYNGWPLYYMTQDKGPGDTRCHGVEGFGGEWYLITPAGDEAED